jgi:hypothetical protein
MAVMGFRHVSLGSSTVQLHDSLGSRRACAYSETGLGSQKGERVRGMYYRRTALCCPSFVGKRTKCKGLSQRNVSSLQWEAFSREVVHIWVANVSLMTKMLKRRCGNLSKTSMLGFGRTGKATGQIYQCWRRICR